MDYSQYTLVAVEAALKAGELLKRRFGSLLDIKSKEGKHNFVTDVDLEAEKIVLDIILSNFPDHSILSEESGEKVGSNVTWIIDPIDGTLNFIRSVPLYAVSIAVAVHGEIIAGALLVPQMGELFMAQKGHGAFLNGNRIQVSQQDSLENAILITGTPYHTPKVKVSPIDQFTKMMQLGCPIRDLGAATIDLAYVAAGRFDGYWMPTVQPWDLAAAKILIEEAGGRLSTYDDSDYVAFVESPILASNGRLHKALVKQFSEAHGSEAHG